MSEVRSVNLVMHLHVEKAIGLSRSAMYSMSFTFIFLVKLIKFHRLYNCSFLTCICKSTRDLRLSNYSQVINVIDINFQGQTVESSLLAIAQNKTTEL